MSGFLSFVTRHRGHVRCINVSSGALQRLFDPDLYAGNESVLQAFLTRRALSPLDTDRSPAPAPWYMGIVVLDLDTRHQWDMQTARELRFLGLDVDWTWEHFSKWHERGWLGQGLVDPLTKALVSRFPPTELPAWYEGCLQAHHARWREAHPGDFMGWAEKAPRLAIEPPGWTFSSFEPNQSRQLQLQLQEAGFSFSPEEDVQWQTWAREHGHA